MKTSAAKHDRTAVLVIGMLFVALLAFAMRIDRRKRMDVGGFAVVELLMFAAVVSIVVAGLFLLGGSAMSLAR